MRYTVYQFPALGGEPKRFRFYLAAWLYAVFVSATKNRVCELKDDKTGIYRSYWV